MKLREILKSPVFPLGRSGSSRGVTGLRVRRHRAGAGPDGEDLTARTSAGSGSAGATTHTPEEQVTSEVGTGDRHGQSRHASEESAMKVSVARDGLRRAVFSTIPSRPVRSGAVRAGGSTDTLAAPWASSSPRARAAGGGGQPPGGNGDIGMMIVARARRTAHHRARLHRQPRDRAEPPGEDARTTR